MLCMPTLLKPGLSMRLINEIYHQETHLAQTKIDAFHQLKDDSIL